MSIESNRFDQHFSRLSTSSERIQYLEYVAYQGVYYQKTIPELLSKIKSELVDSLREYIEKTAARVQKDYDDSKDIRDSIHIYARLMSVPQIVDFFYEKINDYEFLDIHQGLHDIYHFLNDLSRTSTDPRVQHIIDTSNDVEQILRRRSSFADKAPMSLRDILRLDFKVPEYIEVCTDPNYFEALFTPLQHETSQMDIENSILLMSYRTKAAFDQDRKIFAHARDHEADVLEKILYREMDRSWICQRLDRWNQQIAKISEFENNVDTYRDRLYSNAKESFDQHAK